MKKVENNNKIKIVLSLIIIILLLVGIKLGIKEKDNKNEVKTEQEFSYTPLMYEICDDDNCVYLLGSIHMGDERLYKFNNIINEAYKKSSAIAVELDVTSAEIDPNLFVLKDVKTLEDIYNKELIDKIKDFSKRHMLYSYDTLKNYTLGFNANYISLLPYLELGYNTNGIDLYFLNQAKEDNKEIKELETIELQLTFLTDYSDEFYISQIENIIDKYDENKELSKQLYEAYLTGKKENIKKILESDLEPLTKEEEQYQKAMLDDRNINMANHIKNFLEKDENVFVVVGMAHVISDNGIIELLEKDNYQIKIIK